MNVSLSDIFTETVWRLVEQIMSDTVTPSAKGFLIVGAMALKRHWPEATALKCMGDFSEYLHSIGMKFGDPDHDWSAGAARSLAAEYAAEYGDRRTR